jgi:hypothetical protein
MATVELFETIRHPIDERHTCLCARKARFRVGAVSFAASPEKEHARIAERPDLLRRPCSHRRR